ncbi:DUF6254 family protein [Paucisalibacillus globulus]|nr:DUF6254 family protein [Paucisalibacillus globulus]
MTRSNKEKQRQWTANKKAKNPHGKVKSFEQLAEEALKGDK